jgi:hypothetical protein
MRVIPILGKEDRDMSKMIKFGRTASGVWTSGSGCGMLCGNENGKDRW